MKCAIAQLNPIIGNIKGNAQQIKENAILAVQAGANLLLTPELSLCGYPPKDLLLRKSFIQDMQVELEKLAQEIPPQLYLLVGTVTPNPLAFQVGKKPLYNSVALVNDGAVKQVFHKRLLPTYDVFEEDRYFSSGNQPNYFQIGNLKIGVTICEDLWNEEQCWGEKKYDINPIEDLASLNVDLMINLSASPYIVGKQKVREAMLTHIAQQYQTPILYVNQVGGNDDLIFDGNSFSLNRQGQLISKAKAFTTDLVYLDYDASQKDFCPAFINEAISSEEEEIYHALVLGVKDYARKCGFSKAVLGLSGGIDSALVSAIATSALGAENIFGVMMPSPYSSSHSITDAEKLVGNLGIKSTQLPIKEIMESFDTTLDDLFANTQFGVAEENIQSRIRGTLLMAIANKFGYLLLSTGNKSEVAVGYCTLYGDLTNGK